MLVLVTETVGNPDFRQDNTLPLAHAPSIRQPVADQDEAVAAFSAWRDRHDVGCGNLRRADIMDGNTVIARLSYNGRVWPVVEA
ncbi:hypothetical protein [Pacificispira sp.]|uniref:hypothetical protein n=1 Tax=Pacificispira sp. TaxID=2888761 RepID=UPI003BAA1124